MSGIIIKSPKNVFTYFLFETVSTSIFYRAFIKDKKKKRFILAMLV